MPKKTKPVKGKPAGKPAPAMRSGCGASKAPAKEAHSSGCDCEECMEKED